MRVYSTMGLLAGAGLLVAAGAAMAQGAPGEAGPGPQGPGEMRGEMRGEMGPHGGFMREMMRRHREESKAAHFRFRKGDAVVDIKCAADEPTKACVDAGSVLLDKLNPAAAK